jgi:histidyl-tRNA synthetase
MTVTPSTPPGVLELLPAEQAVHDAMLGKIRDGFRRFGFPPIETPVFERTEVLLTKTGGETERQVYFVQSAGAREQGDEPDLALRFDLTVPLARYVAEHEADLVFPFRRSQIQRVYRGERPQRGRYREFYQCDIDVIDRNELSLHHDAEVAAAAISLLGDLGVGNVTLRLNSRRVMRRLLTELGIDGADRQSDVLREIDKLDRRGPEAVGRTLTDSGLTTSSTARLLEWTSTRVSGPEAIIDALSELPGGAEADGGGAQLAEVVRTMSALQVPADRYVLDLSIARGLDYYTGTVYETYLDDHPELGSICSGGRYDDLAGQYTTTRLPGVGLSIGFTRLFWQLREAGLLPDTVPVVEVSVTLLDQADLAYCLSLAADLRSAGIATETQMVASKLGKQLKAADRRGVRLAVIAGEAERAARTVAVKDLRTGDQVEIAADDLTEHVNQRLTEG